MTNSFYTPTGNPSTQARSKSVDIRAEFAAIGAGFDAAGSAFPTNGVVFPAVQVPSANANTLDDYEEGITASSWLPVDSSGAGMALTSPTGQYIKIGRLVFIQCEWNFPSNSSGLTVAIGGLPLPQNNESASLAVGRISGGGTEYQALLVGTATPLIQLSTPASVTINSAVTSKSFQISGCYIAAA